MIVVQDCEIKGACVFFCLFFFFLAGAERRFSDARHAAAVDDAGAPAHCATSARESINERRHSSTATQDLNEYIYSVSEDHDVNEDDDVFEMEPCESGAGGGSGAGVSSIANQPPSSGSALAAASASEVKRRTQSLGSLSGEPKSPRKVRLLSVLSLSLGPMLSLSLSVRSFFPPCQLLLGLRLPPFLIYSLGHLI